MTRTTRPSNLSCEAMSPARRDAASSRQGRPGSDSEGRGRGGGGRPGGTCQFLGTERRRRFPSAPARDSLGLLGTVVRWTPRAGRTGPRGSWFDCWLQLEARRPTGSCVAKWPRLCHPFNYCAIHLLNKPWLREIECGLPPRRTVRSCL